jgi:hypothetical protein
MTSSIEIISAHSSLLLRGYFDNKSVLMQMSSMNAISDASMSNTMSDTVRLIVYSDMANASKL